MVSKSLIQLTTDSIMRKRVMSMRPAAALGATPVGAPSVGWVADSFGPRLALGVGAAPRFAAAVVAAVHIIRCNATVQTPEHQSVTETASLSGCAGGNLNLWISAHHDARSD